MKGLQVMMPQECFFICAKTRKTVKHLFVFRAVGFTCNCHNSSLKNRHICSIKREMCEKKHACPHPALISPSLLLYLFTWRVFASVVALEAGLGLETAFSKSWSLEIVCILYSVSVELDSFCQDQPRPQLLWFFFLNRKVCEIPESKGYQSSLFFESVDAATWLPPMCQREEENGERMLP